MKLHLLLGIEPRQAMGSSLLGRVLMALAAILGYMLGEGAFDHLRPDLLLLVPPFAGSVATMVPGVFLVSRVQRERAVVVVTLLSIALALPTLLSGR